MYPSLPRSGVTRDECLFLCRRLRYLSVQFRASGWYGTRTIREEGNDMEATELVLQTMREAGMPLNAGKIAELSGLDRKVVDKAMKELKKTGAIVSPVRCKWEPAE